MFELNKEYTYKEICEKLGWNYQPSNNGTKKKQTKCIEESYDFYHPLNCKTKKEKKSYIFTKQIKMPVLDDGRKNNGGFRKNAGRKSILPEEEFDYLWKVAVSKAYEFNCYYERQWRNKVYFSNTLLFREFGFDYGHYLKKAKFEEDDKVVKYLFQEIVYETLKANTITKLCKRYGFPKNSLPKGILRSQSINRLDKIIDDDGLLEQYNKFEAEALKEYKCKSVIDVIRQGKYEELTGYIREKFERKRKYNVQRYNMIQVNDFSVIDIGKHFGFQNAEQKNTLEKYRSHFEGIIFISIEKSCMKRIEDKQNKYKVKLNKAQQILLRKYLYNMLGKEYATEDTEVEEYAWLNQIA